MIEFSQLHDNIKKCQLCHDKLPHGVKPILQIDPRAKILVAGQAPGRKAHDSGIPFDDLSGQRLRQWLGLSAQQFYDPEIVAILPMGFCFPGTGKSGDLAPLPICAQTWRAQILQQLPNIELTVILGKYAQDYHLGKSSMTVTQRVQAWPSTWPQKIALPHPSGRNNIWLKRNEWFEQDVIPMLQQRVAEVI